MKQKEISKSVLKRLPVYLAYLKSLPADAPEYISATTIANALGMGDVQTRKDLATVSTGGRPKVGYCRKNLVFDLEQYLGYDNTDDSVLIGAGKLGQALLGYSGFDDYGLNIIAAFDVHPTMSLSNTGKPIVPMEMLEEYCRSNKIMMGIIAVPASCAQEACDRLVASGIKAIWNFAPTHLEVPEHILVQNENMATSLAVLSMHLRAQMKEKK